MLCELRRKSKADGAQTAKPTEALPNEIANHRQLPNSPISHHTQATHTHTHTFHTPHTHPILHTQTVAKLPYLPPHTSHTHTLHTPHTPPILHTQTHMNVTHISHKPHTSHTHTLHAHLTYTLSILYTHTPYYTHTLHTSHTHHTSH